MLRRAQSNEESFLEAATNVSIGFAIALVTQAVAYPLLGISSTFETNSIIAAIFTVVSLIRSYLVRRAFETFGLKISRIEGEGGARS
jgi:hypothetical protein